MLEAVNDFVITYAPNAIQNNLFRGYQNRMALPQQQNFIVVSVEDTARVGTNTTDYSQADDGKLITKALREYLVSIDFCNIKQEIAQEQAANIEVISRSYIATDFFKQRDIGFNYADDIMYLPYVDEQDQYLHRYRVTLHLTKWEQVAINQDFAKTVQLRIENIDAHHKPIY